MPEANSRPSVYHNAGHGDDAIAIHVYPYILVIHNLVNS